MISLLLALTASLQQPSNALAVFDCSAADASHDRSAVIGVYRPPEPSELIPKVHVRVEPVAGFDDPTGFELTNVEVKRLRNDPENPAAGSFLRFASGMGGEGERSPWRISITIGDAQDGKASILAALTTYSGAERTAYMMNCTMREGQSQ